MYGRTYRSKTSAYKKRKQNRKRATTTRRRTTMRKRPFRKNTPLMPSAEKKYFDYGLSSTNFAKYNDISTLSNGYSCTDFSVKCDQGLAVNARIGNKIFMTGAIFDYQFASMTSATNQIRYKWYLVRIPEGYDYPATDIVPPMFDANPFAVGTYDWHSLPDPETSSQFKIVAKGQGSLKADNISAQTSYSQGRKYLKLGFNCKFDNQTSGSPPITNQMRLILQADSGGVVQGTGITASVNLRVFYLDN